MKRLLQVSLLLISMAALLGLAALLMTAPGASRAAAQGAALPTITPSPIPTATLSPTPDAVATQAAAYFQVTTAQMNSLYPRGVEYVLQISSSAGEIERVTVAFWDRDGSIRSSNTLDWDESRQAYVYYDRMFRPPWFEINYRFRALDSAGNVYETADMVSEYADLTREWFRREDDRIIVLMFGARESLADDLFRSAHDAIIRLEETHGFKLDYKPYVVVMPDQASFQEWQEYPDPFLAGLTYNQLGYTVQTLQWGETDLIEATVPHELTHIFQGFVAEARDIPTWFIEGHATYFEPQPQYDYEQRVRDIVWHPDFPTLQADIMADRSGPDGRNRWAYDIGYTFIRYWIDNYGWESHRRFWQAQVTMNFEDAMAFATGRSFEELETEWRRWIGAPGPVPTLFPSPTLPPFPTAAPMPTLPGM